MGISYNGWMGVGVGKVGRYGHVFRSQLCAMLSQDLLNGFLRRNGKDVFWDVKKSSY